MSSPDHASEEHGALGAFLTSPLGLALIGLLAIVSIDLWIEHRVHLLALLVWLPLAGCALMHLFHGHGGHDPHGTRSGRASPGKPGDRRSV